MSTNHGIMINHYFAISSCPPKRNDRSEPTWHWQRDSLEQFGCHNFINNVSTWSLSIDFFGVSTSSNCDEKLRFVLMKNKNRSWASNIMEQVGMNSNWNYSVFLNRKYNKSLRNNYWIIPIGIYSDLFHGCPDFDIDTQADQQIIDHDNIKMIKWIGNDWKILMIILESFRHYLDIIMTCYFIWIEFDRFWHNKNDCHIHLGYTSIRTTFEERRGGIIARIE